MTILRISHFKQFQWQLST